MISRRCWTAIELDYTTGEYLGFIRECPERGLDDELDRRAELLIAVPTISYDHHAVVADGNHLVVERLSQRAIRANTGTFRQRDAKSDTFGHDTLRIEQGRIAESHGTTNYLRALMQVGIPELPRVKFRRSARPKSL